MLCLWSKLTKKTVGLCCLAEAWKSPAGPLPRLSALFWGHGVKMAKGYEKICVCTYTFTDHKHTPQVFLWITKSLSLFLTHTHMLWPYVAAIAAPQWAPIPPGRWWFALLYIYILIGLSTCLCSCHHFFLSGLQAVRSDPSCEGYHHHHLVD